MISRHLIRAYVHTLASQLGTLEHADAEEVIREIESHLHEVVDQAEAREEPLDVAALLEGFGPPEALAAQYIAHILEGAPPPAGLRVLQRVKHTVTHGLYYSMGAFGFSVALAFFLLAVAKVVAPSSVGVWSAAAGNSVVITWAGAPHPGDPELLGYWLVPLALLAASWSSEVTRRVLRVLRRGLS